MPRLHRRVHERVRPTAGPCGVLRETWECQDRAEQRWNLCYQPRVDSKCQAEKDTKVGNEHVKDKM